VAFFKAYVEDSVQEFPILGSKEKELRPSITLAYSLLGI
jgi:hypothetical protein